MRQHIHSSGPNVKTLQQHTTRAWSHRRRRGRATAVSQLKAKGRLTWADDALERHGATIIVAARFIPGGRTATTLTAGTVRLPRLRLTAADAVGATLWAAYAAGLGYLGGETFERRPLSAFLFGLGVALLVALVVEAARRLRRRVPGLAVGGRLEGRSER